jgi:hypothetical protein
MSFKRIADSSEDQSGFLGHSRAPEYSAEIDHAPACPRPRVTEAHRPNRPRPSGITAQQARHRV